MAKRFPMLRRPMFKAGLLNDPFNLKHPSKIFVGSSGDMFGDWVKSADIEAILEVERYCKRHTFQHLTKNPSRYAEFKFAPNIWIGTTVDGMHFTKHNLKIFLSVTSLIDCVRFISFEPLIQRPVVDSLAGIDWVIIGADSTPGARRPPMLWADELVDMARDVGAAVWVKDNYRYPERIKEFPRDRAQRAA